MSTDYDAYCLDCDEECGIEDANNCYNQLVEIVAHAPALAELGKVRGWLHMNWDGVRLNSFEWFARHAGHKLCVATEYGELYNADGSEMDRKAIRS